MTQKHRAYSEKKDYRRVYDFLVETYKAYKRPANWLPTRWEYMHYHPYLDKKSLGKIGVWEDGGKIAGVAHYEDKPGIAYFEFHPDYTHLKNEMLDHAEKNLCRVHGNGRLSLRFFTNDCDRELNSIARERKYTLAATGADCWHSSFPRARKLPDAPLPKGYRIASLASENDLKKLDRCIWRGFNHTGEPEKSGIRERKLMQSAPNFRHDLNIIAINPKGEYVSYAGMWHMKEIKVGYVEPVATDPDYRFMGLGKACMAEGMKRLFAEGARQILVGSNLPFYMALGFKTEYKMNVWVKYFG